MLLEDPYAYVVAAFHAPPSPGLFYRTHGSTGNTPQTFVPEPVYQEFMPPEDEVFPAEEQPLLAAASPTAQSPGYVPESDLEEDPEEDDYDPEEDPANYPTDRDDDDEEEEPSGDDADDYSSPRVPNSRVTSLDQQALFRRRKPYNVAYNLSNTKLNTESYFEVEPT
ncbi:hypothetical protein Tco_1541793 [Tanacetum coccineum]